MVRCAGAREADRSILRWLLCDRDIASNMVTAADDCLCHAEVAADEALYVDLEIGSKTVGVDRAVGAISNRLLPKSVVIIRTAAALMTMSS